MFVLWSLLLPCTWWQLVCSSKDRLLTHLKFTLTSKLYIWIYIFIWDLSVFHWIPTCWSLWETYLFVFNRNFLFFNNLGLDLYSVWLRINVQELLVDLLDLRLNILQTGPFLGTYLISLLWHTALATYLMRKLCHTAFGTYLIRKLWHTALGTYNFSR